jgi:hypothetical protein
MAPGRSATMLGWALLLPACMHYVTVLPPSEPPPEPAKAAVAPDGGPAPTTSTAAPAVSAGPASASEGPAAPPTVSPELLARMTFRGEMPTATNLNDPAAQNANASSSYCRKEVERRKLPVVRVKSAAKGISDTVRISGAFNEVKLVVPEGKHGMLDCRLALALDDFTKVLHEFGIVELQIDNFYRPNAKLPGQKKDSQHAHGLAIDLTVLKTADGRTFTPADWGASIGEKACGPEAVMSEPSEARVDLRNLFCEVGRRRIFHTVLSPSFNAAHQSHFHLDIKRDAKHASVR